jgi:hypothetical protein
MRPQEPVSDQHALLLDYVERLNHHRDGRRMIHLHLSALRPQNRRDHHIRIAMNAFEGLIRRFEGQMFHLRNDDLFIGLRGAGVAEIDDVVLKLRFLFSEDPLFGLEEAAPGAPGAGAPAGAPGPGAQAFCTWYDLGADYIQLLNDVRYLVRASENRAARAAAGDCAEPRVDERRPLDPVTLGRLETAMRTIDIGGLVRRQPICAVVPGSAPKPMFSELFVSIALLHKKLVPDIDLFGDRWLFQRLTETLDQRVLSILPEVEGRTSLPTCVNVNVRTLLSPEFLVFDKLLRQRTQKVMVFELQSIDVFGDMGSFMFARDFVRDRGYRLSLDGLNHLIFPLFDRAALGFDFQKIHWSPDIVTEMQQKRRAALRDAIKTAGSNRIILCRCDSADAVGFGHSVGISLFQGSHIDALLGQAPTAAAAQAAAQATSPAASAMAGRA